jgi:energy-coupling factor transporter transmembrane protein EcfT
MGTLELVARLNRRHKVVLFVTLLAAGFILITGGGIGPGLGSILLGIAFALAVGSNSRAIHGLFVTTGLVLLLAPTLYFWVAARRQEKALARMANDSQSSTSVGEDARDEWQVVSTKPQPFVLHDVIVENRGTEAAGLVLFAIGMGLLIVVKPASAQT